MYKEKGFEMSNNTTREQDFIRARALEKITKIEREKEFFERAIRAKICPECTALLQRYRGDFNESRVFNIKYKCTACTFVYKKNILHN